jgi:hypothetical protein
MDLTVSSSIKEIGMRQNVCALYVNSVWCTVLRNGCFGLMAMASVLVFADTAHAESFIPPYSGNLYMQCIGGSAGATSQFGLGSAPSNFVSYLNGLPQSCPDSEVLVGPVTAGQPVEFAMSTLWLGQTYWAFSFNSDQGSKVTFNDVCNSLGMNGNIIQRTSPNTWVMYLNDAAHYTIDQCEAKNIIIQLRLVGNCSLRSLIGPYAYALTGSKAGHGEHQRSFSAVGLLVADGNGNFTATDTVSDAGQITNGRQSTGTYTVNSDCSGSAAFSGLGQMNLVLSDDNRRVDLIQTDDGTNITGTAHQQFH